MYHLYAINYIFWPANSGIRWTSSWDILYEKKIEISKFRSTRIYLKIGPLHFITVFPLFITNLFDFHKKLDLCGNTFKTNFIFKIYKVILILRSKYSLSIIPQQKPCEAPLKRSRQLGFRGLGFLANVNQRLNKCCPPLNLNIHSCNRLDYFFTMHALWKVRAAQPLYRFFV